MAYNNNRSSSALFLIALIFCAASNPSANAQLLGLLRVNGGLCCTSAGNCTAGSQGVGGVLVRLNCTNIFGITNTVGQAITDANGLFNIVSLPLITRLIAAVLGRPPCTVDVALPLNSTVCPIFNTTTGVLSSTLRTVDSVVTPFLGLVQNTTLNGFVITVGLQ